MSATQPIIFLTAAEASGDTHAANLITVLARRLPSARFIGVGGPRMAAAGCELLEDVTAHASMLLGPLTKIPYFRRVIAQVDQAMAQTPPDVLVPVDSPALNWHMASAARRRGVPVMYYVAPQVWAWGPWRVRKVRRLTDHVACLLPFEPEYFRQRGVPATFVGHPLFDHVPPREPAPVQPPADDAWRIILLPGSRPGEIRNHAAAMVRTAELIRARHPRAEFTICVENDRAAGQVAELAGTSLPIVAGRTHEIMARSHFAIAKSGTVTLETAYFGLPMVVVYRASRLAYNLVRWWLFRTKYLSAVNIVAGREMVPELMPWGGNVDELANAALRQLENPQALLAKSSELLALADTLRPPTGQSPSEGTAELVLRTMKQ